MSVYAFVIPLLHLVTTRPMPLYSSLPFLCLPSSTIPPATHSSSILFPCYAYLCLPYSTSPSNHSCIIIYSRLHYPSHAFPPPPFHLLNTRHPFPSYAYLCLLYPIAPLANHCPPHLSHLYLPPSTIPPPNLSCCISPILPLISLSHYSTC